MSIFHRLDNNCIVRLYCIEKLPNTAIDLKLHERHFLLYVSFGDWIAHLCDFVAFPGALILMVDGPHLSVISVFIFLYLRGGRSGEAGVSYPSISFLYVLFSICKYSQYFIFTFPATL